MQVVLPLLQTKRLRVPGRRPHLSYSVSSEILSKETFVSACCWCSRDGARLILLTYLSALSSLVVKTAVSSTDQE